MDVRGKEIIGSITSSTGQAEGLLILETACRLKDSLLLGVMGGGPSEEEEFEEEEEGGPGDTERRRSPPIWLST
ncbi:hypothetical protein EYF80_015901 [Liparis tanakae]|uniref:Uncharacterized protein n=1 Tax=Liparis tanakae TaxID=230148 RepID=A0A4Z2I938_9TELE|nr:hypothetical protein EYF80_015901 [Liparis tanakae]